MSNFAAIIPAATTPLVVQEVEIYTPGPQELVIKNEVIAFNPIEYKIAKYAVFPLEYPAIIGSSFGGTVLSVGSGVTRFKVGDKVAAVKKLGANGNQYGSFQQYVVVNESLTSKVAPSVDVDVVASLTGNLPTVVGIFTGRLGLGKPSLEGSATVKDKKVLVYGGSSSVGSLAVQYVAQAGYTAITTSSPKNNAFVSKLGAAKIVDHTQDKDAVIKALVAEGPYDLVFDTISLPTSTAITGQVVVAQGGGELHVTLPTFGGPETLPTNVTRVFESWSASLFEEKNKGLAEWAFHEYLAQGVASGRVIPLPIQKVEGGLKGVTTALGLLEKGVSGVKLVLDPRE
ncbi:alcohol dehydrogenase GroES-like domain-containing protein [Leptodontidium sp. MPI-SDFR-AT-0119]|nr:alcohol dehydrogenase GroES-like domain-containing protein [Leptodontidium sp. MPI-SDFR-AT-0119]